MKTLTLIKIICLTFSILFSISVSGQWQQLPGPDGIVCSVVHQHNGNIFISNHINQIYSGVYRSANNGNSWVDIGAGLPAPFAKDFASLGTNLFAALDTSIFMTTNMGTTWTNASGNLPSSGTITNLTSFGGALYVSIFTGFGTDEIFYSTNNGVSWATTGFYAPVSDFFVDGNKLWCCGSNGAIYVTTDGINWTLKAGNIPFSAYVQTIGGIGDTLICSFTYNVYMTTDGGNLWMPIASGIPVQATGKDVQLSGNTVFLGTLNHGIYTSTLGSNNWTLFGTN